MNVLVLNCGSSTVKFRIVETDRDRIERDADRHLARGIVERIGGDSRIRFRAEGGAATEAEIPVRDHRAAIDHVLRWVVSERSGIGRIGSPADIHAVGHRVVHGGERFRGSVLIDDRVLRAIEDCVELAPLHNPANLKGIRAVREALGPGVPQAAVFDTAFHATLPESAFLYGVPYDLYRRHRLRRYGFHGTSHRYVAYRYRRMLGVEREAVNLVTLHLGNGCSACAIRGGRSVDTSMGFTPLEGLLMGTRCGDVDPAIPLYLQEKEGLSLAEVDALLNEESGLLGLSGTSSDMRDLLRRIDQGGDPRAKLAVDVFCHRARKYVGAYAVAAGGADALIFTGGIGENAVAIRRQICEGLEPIGLQLDERRNSAVRDGRSGKISTGDSRLASWVIPTDEELLIARDTVRAVESGPG